MLPIACRYWMDSALPRVFILFERLSSEPLVIAAPAPLEESVSRSIIKNRKAGQHAMPTSFTYRRNEAAVKCKCS
jgi:hypothetical protein